MKRTIIWVLAAANVALAGTLAWRGIGDNTAHAANAAVQTGSRQNDGNYVLIPGESSLGVAIIYVFDANNRRLGAIAPDNQDKISGMPTIDLDPVFEAAERGNSGTGTGGTRTGTGRPNQPRTGGNR